MNKALILVAFFIVLTVVTNGVIKYINSKSITPRSILNEMTVEQKVGQLFMLGFWGQEPDYYITKMISEREIGGVILFKYNIDNKDQVIKLTTKLQKMSTVPLFISVDQEGGVVSRVEFEGTSSISQADIKDETEAFTVAKRRAEELKELGINMNLSPVVDSISDENAYLFNRAFRGERDEIVSLSKGMIKGYKEGGVLSTIKHFPGHSNASVDFHSALDSVDIPGEELDLYIYPFKEALGVSDAVIVGHILFPQIDAQYPASLSPYFINDLLRKKLGFNGLVITDDMQMKSVYDRYSIAQAAVQAILAGNDILIYSGSPQEQADAYNAVVKAVNDGVISEKDLDSKVLRILTVKNSL